MKRMALAMVLVLAGLGLAQQPSQPPATSPPNSTPPILPHEQTPRRQMPQEQEAQPSGEMSSSQVQQQIQQSLSADPSLWQKTALTVRAEDSSVVLTGVVDNEDQHQMALRIARSYASKRQVVDKVKVRQKT